MTDHMDPNEHMVSIPATTHEGLPPHAHPLTFAPRHEAPTAQYLTSDEFFALAGKVVTEEVYVPAIDRTVIVKALTAADVQRARSDITETKGGRTVPRQDRDFSAMVTYYATVSPDGTPFFRREQIDMLNKETNYAAISPIAKVALRLSGLDDEAEELARKKHLEGAKSDDRR